MRRLGDLTPPTRRQIRVAVGVLWLLDAALQAAPALFSADWWRTDLAQSAMGEPTPINHSIFWAVNVVAAHAAIWNTGFVAIQAALGLSLIIGRFERAAIVASIPWALGIWWVGEGFGTLPTGFALAASGAPGPAVLYPLIATLAWPSRHPAAADVPGDVVRSATISWRGGATAWVVLWAGQTLLQIPWAFPSRQVLVANVSEYSAGQPGWLQAVARGTESLARHHSAALTAAMVVVQVGVGVGVLGPKTRQAGLAVGIAVSIVYWFAFQYLGTLPAGDATDASTAPLMILLAASLWPPPTSETSLGPLSRPARRGHPHTRSPAVSSVAV